MLAEALFNGTAREVALDNATYIQIKIEEIKSEEKRTLLAQAKAAVQDEPLFAQKVSLLGTAYEALKTALQAYKRIADDASLKIKTTPNLKSELAKLPSEGDQASAFSLAQNEALQNFCSLSEQTTNASRIVSLNILSKLDEISETENDHVILGRRGEIELVNEITSPNPDIKRRREGIKHAEIAIVRDFGTRGLQLFRAHFHNEIMALESPESQNVLTLGKLKAFVHEEDQRNPSAFYLSSTHPISELIFLEDDAAEDSKLLKSDKTSFNPFSRRPLKERPLSENQEIAAGITATRAALKELFKDLPAEHRQSILNEFNKQFTTTGNNIPLTVGELKSFIKIEVEKLKSLIFDITGPFLYSFAWHAGVSSLWTLMMSAHLPPYAVMAISLSIGIGHDLTSFWRQLRPEEESENK